MKCPDVILIVNLDKWTIWLGNETSRCYFWLVHICVQLLHFQFKQFNWLLRISVLKGWMLFGVLDFERRDAYFAGSCKANFVSGVNRARAWPHIASWTADDELMIHIMSKMFLTHLRLELEDLSPFSLSVITYTSLTHWCFSSRKP